MSANGYQQIFPSTYVKYNTSAPASENRTSSFRYFEDFLIFNHEAHAINEDMESAYYNKEGWSSGLREATDPSGKTASSSAASVASITATVVANTFASHLSSPTAHDSGDSFNFESSIRLFFCKQFFCGN